MAQPSVASRSGNPYENSDLVASFGSMEGLPEWVDPTESPAEKAGRSPWQAIGNRGFEALGGALPGLALALSLAAVGTLMADWIGMQILGFDETPLSPILVAILLGLAIRNTIGLPSVYEPGLQLALKKILRVGVALLGIRLSFTAAGAIGLVAVPIVIVCIASALVFVTWVNRALGLPGRLGTLVAVGTAICGNTAIVATAPVIGAKDDEVSYAVGCVTVFGLIALVGYPSLSQWLFAGDAQLSGFFLGTAIHDTAQVAGAGMVYLQQFGTDEALNTATVTKLIRNMFMLGVIPLVAYIHHRRERGGTGGPGLATSQMTNPSKVLSFLDVTGDWDPTLALVMGAARRGPRVCNGRRNCCLPDRGRRVPDERRLRRAPLLGSERQSRFHALRRRGAWNHRAGWRDA